jgi:predicted deacylase
MRPLGTQRLLIHAFLGLFVFACSLPQTVTPAASTVIARVEHETRTLLPTLPYTPTPTITFSLTPSFTQLPTSSQTVSSTPTEPPSPTPQSWSYFIIGFSVDRRPLDVYQFGSGANERMIVAGIHGGNEWNTIALAEEMIAHIKVHPEIVPADVTLYILHDLNPDGEARGHDANGRANAHGVDLNRNWAANWKAQWNDEKCWNLRPISAGRYAFSEPETKALQLFLLHHSINALLSYHSAALGIFPGGLPPDKNSIRLAKAIAAVSTYPYPPLIIGCEYTGTLVDWASFHGIAALDVELSNHTDIEFEMNLRILNAFLNWKP